LKLALTITPQRSTQYSNMAQALAAPELLASPLAPAISSVESVTLSGQAHLLVTINEQIATPAMLGSASLRVNSPSRRGEGGGEWLGGPLWSPAVPRKDADPT
jgi:hypothetical protein